MTSTSKILKLHEVDRRVFAVIPCGLTPSSSNGRKPSSLAVIEPTISEAAQNEAEAIIEAAREEARSIVARAETEAQVARDEGYQVGYEAGVAAAGEEMRQYVESIARIASNVTVDKAELIKECETEIVSLVLAVAQKVVAKEISLDRSIIVKLVERAISRVTGQAILRVRVNPNDYDIVREYWSEMADVADGTQIVADKRVARGGCVIDTQGGAVDAQARTQLTEIKRTFEVLTELM